MLLKQFRHLQLLPTKAGNLQPCQLLSLVPSLISESCSFFPPFLLDVCSMFYRHMTLTVNLTNKTYFKVVWERGRKEKENQLDYTIAQQVKNLPVTQEMWIWSLGQEDPLEKELATHSTILAWKIPRTEESSGLQSMESQKSPTWLSD